jgi:PAS domain S-box-containing protein
MPDRDVTWRGALLDALRDGVFVLDAEGAVVEMNEAFGSVLGYGPAGLPYRPPVPWWPDPDRDPEDFALAAQVSRAVRDGVQGQWLVRLRHRAGHWVWVECSTAEVDARPGGERRTVGLIRDATGQVRARARDQLLAETGRLMVSQGRLGDRLDSLVAAAAAAFGALVVLATSGSDGLLRPVAAADPQRSEVARAARAGGAHRVPESARPRYRTGRAHLEPDPAGGERIVAPLVAGERLLGRLTVGRPVEGPGHDRASLDLAEELARRVTGLLEAERVATRERRLSEAGAALAGASTVGEAAEALARALREALGPFGVVVFTAHPDDPTRLHLQHNIGYPPEFTARFGVFSRDTHGPTAAMLRHGRPLWLGDRTAWRALYPDMVELGGLRRAQAAMVVPLRHGGRTLGVVAAAFGTAREFPSDERGLVLNLVEQAAQAFERAALSDARWDIARTLQQSLLPARLPDVDRLGLAAHYQPAGRHNQAGGDWYDVIPLDESRVAMVVGDVVGHGAAAAAVMGQLRAALAACLLDDHSPARALRLLSRVAGRIDGALASTAVCLVLDVATGELTWSSAGHPPPLVVDPADRRQPVRFLTEGRGGVLGAGRRGGFSLALTEARTTLAPGAAVVLYPDGLIERRRESAGRGLARLATAALTARDPEPAALVASVLAGALAGVAPEDDVAVVVARRSPLPAADGPRPRPDADVDPVAVAGATVSALAGEVRLTDEVRLRWHPDGGLTVSLAGALDLAATEGARGEVARCVAACPGRVVIDTAEVTYLGSAGVRLITEAAEIADGRLSLRVLPGTVAANSLAISGFLADHPAHA